jgi:hypothetical protein
MTKKQLTNEELGFLYFNQLLITESHKAEKVLNAVHTLAEMVAFENAEVSRGFYLKLMKLLKTAGIEPRNAECGESSVWVLNGSIKELVKIGKKCGLEISSI